jgi:hypothetical protein
MTTAAISTHDRMKDTPPRLRRRFPLSLRMFVAILTILSVGSAFWIGGPAYLQYMAIREIERQEGVVRSEPAGPTWLRGLARGAKMRLFDKVVAVEITGRNASEATMSHVGHLTELQ